MSANQPTASGSELADGPTRPIPVRTTEELRAQLDILAQLNDRTLTEEIRAALEGWLVTSKADPRVLERAETVRAEIDREAKTKQSAIQALFGEAVEEMAPRSKPTRS